MQTSDGRNILPLMPKNMFNTESMVFVLSAFFNLPVDSGMNFQVLVPHTPLPTHAYTTVTFGSLRQSLPHCHRRRRAPNLRRYSRHIRLLYHCHQSGVCRRDSVGPPSRPLLEQREVPDPPDSDFGRDQVLLLPPAPSRCAAPASAPAGSVPASAPPTTAPSAVSSPAPRRRAPNRSARAAPSAPTATASPSPRCRPSTPRCAAAALRPRRCAR